MMITYAGWNLFPPSILLFLFSLTPPLEATARTDLIYATEDIGEHLLCTFPVVIVRGGGSNVPLDIHHKWSVDLWRGEPVARKTAKDMEEYRLNAGAPMRLEERV